MSGDPSPSRCNPLTMRNRITLREEWVKRTRAKGEAAGRLLRQVQKAYQEGLKGWPPGDSPSVGAVQAVMHEVAEARKADPPRPHVEVELEHARKANERLPVHKRLTLEEAAAVEADYYQPLGRDPGQAASYQEQRLRRGIGPMGVASTVGCLLGLGSKEAGACVLQSDLVLALMHRYRVSRDDALKQVEGAVQCGALQQEGGYCWVGRARKEGEVLGVVKTPCKQPDAEATGSPEGSLADRTEPKAFQSTDDKVDARVADVKPLMDFLWMKAKGWKVRPEADGNGGGYWKATVGTGSWKATNRVLALVFMARDLGWTGVWPEAAVKDDEVKRWLLMNHGHEGNVYVYYEGPKTKYTASITGKPDLGQGPSPEEARLGLALKLGFTWGDDKLEEARKQWQEGLPDRVEAVESLVGESEERSGEDPVPTDAEVVRWLDQNEPLGWMMEHVEEDKDDAGWLCGCNGVTGFGRTPAEARWAYAKVRGYKPEPVSKDPGWWHHQAAGALFDGHGFDYRTMIHLEGDELVVTSGKDVDHPLRVKLKQLLGECWELWNKFDLIPVMGQMQQRGRDEELDECIKVCRKEAMRHDRYSSNEHIRGVHFGALDCAEELSKRRKK